MKTNTFTIFLFCCICFIMISCSDNTNQEDIKLFPVMSGEKWGYINKEGKYVINPQFKDAYFFRGGLAKIESTEGKTGFINEKGKYVIPAKYKMATHFMGGLSFVVSEGRFPVCIDKSGEVKFSLKNVKYVCAFTEELALIVDAEDKYGFVDKSGKTVINAQFESARPFSEGLAAVQQNEKWGYIDKLGKIIINPQFEGVGDFKEGMAIIKSGNEYGYVSKDGKIVINPQFGDAGAFHNKMAVVKQGNSYGYISKDGKIVINPQFDFAGQFQNKMAVIKQGDSYGYINNLGKIEINPQFDMGSDFFGNIAMVKSAEKWGIIDKKGKFLVNPQFDMMKNVFETISYVISDYYDATKFINKFFEKASIDNSFDNFSLSSTLQSVIDNAIYGKYANCTGDGSVTNFQSGADVANFLENSEVVCNNIQKITDDISIDKVTFHFNNRICDLVSDSYGTRSKQFKVDEKVSVISYNFSLSGDANGKEEVIANQIKSFIETKFKVKFSREDNGWGIFYAFAGNDKICFAITTSKDIQEYSTDISNHLEFFVAFDKKALGIRFGSIYSMD